jgi:serine/threonine-protein kinase
MPSQWDRRAARLAAERFGAAQERVRQAYQEALLERERGQAGDLLAILVRQGLLTPAQAAELRSDLDRTQFGPRAPGPSQTAAGPLTTAAPPEPVQVLPLQSIGGYRLLRKLGEGGMGEVYLAFDEEQDQEVAIKLLAPVLAESPSLVERFQREARHGIQLNHPNIVRTYAVGQDKATGQHFLVMEYVDGPTAQQLLDTHGRLAVGDAVHIVLDIAMALENAQARNLIHRDIKPENILLTRSGLAKLADLGLAKRTDQANHLTATRQGFGTPYYMPYEQAVNAKYADGRSDLFALGATLYHLVTGQVPFPGDTPVEVLERKNQGTFTPAGLIDPGLPGELDRILARLLARHPEDRYQTASELIVELERSGLAAPFLSFVDVDLAMQDPLVRARAASANQVTQADGLRERPEAQAEDLWFIRTADGQGRTQDKQYTAAQVVAQLKQGKLRRTALASLAAEGPYRHLNAFPPFREALRHLPAEKPAEPPRPPEPPGPRYPWWLWAAVVLAGAWLVAGLVWLAL